MSDRPDSKSTATGVTWAALIAAGLPREAAERVRLHRRVRSAGALAVRDGVYALPDAPETRAALGELERQIEQHRGTALPCLVTWLDPADERALGDRLDAERQRTRRESAAGIAHLERVLSGEARSSAAERRTAAARLARLRRRAGSTQPAAAAPLALPPAAGPRAIASRAPRPARGTEGYRARTWVTRRGVMVDRIASAWLIRRFVDAHARFRFVAPGAAAAAGEIRFDMPDGEFTHVGGACTFETLSGAFRPADAALHELAEIVHDLDIKDGKFGRMEAPGLAALISGLAAVEPDDAARLERGAPLFDFLYSSLGRGSAPQLPKGLLP